MDTKALRQKILDLAIRGKLVPQDPNDEPASVLLERIRTQKQQMVKDGKLKAKDIKNDTVIFKGDDNLHYEKFQDGSVKCIEDEIPFEVPEGWAWSRFGSIVTLMSGTTYPSDKECLSGARLYVKVADMNIPQNEYEIVTSSRYLDEYSLSHLVPINSVIFPKRGGAIATNKKKLVLRNEILIDLNTMAFTPTMPMNLLYCYYWFLSVDLGKINSGSSVPQINNKDIEPLLFPVPPISEQRKIVESIIPLFEMEQKIRATGYEVADLVSNVKSKILDLAIRGKLVPQDPNDEPASVLLERIRAEKEELIKQGKIKRDKKESVIFKGEDNSYYEKIGEVVRCIDKEIPFESPGGWAWCRLGTLFQHNTGKALNSSDIDGISLPYITTSNVYWDRFELKNLRTMLFTENEMDKCTVIKGDLLVCEGGDIGRAAIWDSDSTIMIQNHIHRLRPYCNLNIKLYYYIFLFYKMVGAIEGNGIGLQGLSSNRLHSLLVPLPPLDEQNKIVNRIKHLFAIITNIEASLN